MEEIREVFRKKEEEIVDLEVATMELRNYVEQLENQSGIACQCKKIGEVGPKQRTRKLKVLKESPERALWFAKSFGLELVSLKCRDANKYQNYSFKYKLETSNMDAEEQEEGNSNALSDTDNWEI